MKKISLLFFALLVQLSISLAQPPPPPQGAPSDFDESKPGNEKIEAMKIAFITKLLQLTPDEAQKFWPVYNQFELEKKEIRKSTIGTLKGMKDDGEVSASEADNAVNQYVLFKSKELDLLKKYITAFKSILPIQKVAKLISAEDRFKKMLTKQAQKGGPGGMPPKKPKPR